MKFITKMLLTAIAVVVISYILPGVQVDGFTDAIIVALVLAVLRVTVKPVLIILTLPATILSLGLFLFVINALIIMLASSIINGFGVSSFLVALGFSLLLSLFQSILYSMIEDKKEK